MKDTAEKDCDRIEEVCLKQNEEVLIIKMADKTEFSERPIKHHKFPN